MLWKKSIPLSLIFLNVFETRSLPFISLSNPFEHFPNNFFKVFNCSIESCKNKSTTTTTKLYNLITNDKAFIYKRDNFTIKVFLNASGIFLDLWIASRNSGISVNSTEFGSVFLYMFFTRNSWNPKDWYFCILFVFFSFLHSRSPPTHKAHCFASGSLWVGKARIRIFNKVW